MKVKKTCFTLAQDKKPKPFDTKQDHFSTSIKWSSFLGLSWIFYSIDFSSHLFWGMLFLFCCQVH